jgi:uncharacterized membrane protein
MSIENPRGFLRERYFRIAFEVGVWAKGAFALVELAGGVLAFFVSHRLIVALASDLTQGELAENRHDLIANFLMRSAENSSVSTQHFTAIYLSSHGLIKLWLAIGLLRRRLWYYPTAIVIFTLFIAYQLYRYTATHSIWLLLITALDVIVIGLTWHEYRFLGGHPGAAKGPTPLV